MCGGSTLLYGGVDRIISSQFFLSARTSQNPERRGFFSSDMDRARTFRIRPLRHRNPQPEDVKNQSRNRTVGMDYPDVIYTRVGACLGLQLPPLRMPRWTPLPRALGRSDEVHSGTREKSRNQQYGDMGRRTNAGEPNSVRVTLGIERRRDSLGDAHHARKASAH